MYDPEFLSNLTVLKHAVGEYEKLNELLTKFSQAYGAIPGEYTSGFSFDVKPEDIPYDKRASYLYGFTKEMIECCY